MNEETTGRARTRRHPTRRAVFLFALGGGLAVLTAALDPGLWTWWLGFCALAVLVFGYDVLFSPRLGALRVRLQPIERLFVGSQRELRFGVDNPSSVSFLAQWKLDVDEPLDEPAPVTTQVAARDQGDVALGVRARRRGTATATALWVRARGPLGLVVAQRRFPLEIALPVVPDLPTVTRDAMQLFATRSLVHGARVERFRGDGSEFDQLLEYVPGMDVRSIDWKASARHAAMRCRQTRAERNRQVIVAIDSGRIMGEPLAGLPRVDHAITAGLTLAYVSLHVGDRVGLASFDERLRQYCDPLAGTGAMTALNQLATGIEYSPSETNFTLGLMELSRRQTRRAFIVVMTDFVDTITSELMLENVARLSRRHLVLFVALRDPLLAEVSGTAPSDLRAMQKAVVGHRLSNDRQLVLKRLQRMGVLTVDAPPGQLAPAMIDRYLAAKRRERF